jgi:hypothetical protein
MNALKTLSIFVIGIALLFSGCAGARNLVKADKAKYDVSLSKGLRESSGRLIPPEQLEVVGAYKQRAFGWGLVWSWVSLNSINISKSVNEQVEKAGGNAVTNLAVDVQGGFLNFFPIFNWLPIWPGYNIVHFSGDIVKIKAEPPPPPPPPPPVIAPEPVAPPPEIAPAPSLNEEPAAPKAKKRVKPKKK